jgi:hypothetical protein
MAATGRKAAGFPMRICAILLAACGVAAIPARADASSDARSQVTAVAEALTSGDAAQAMTHFAKSFPDYEKLRVYFEGLSAFQIENELEITDEQDTGNSVALIITWDITLTDVGSDRSRRRTGEIHVKLIPVESKWRIVEFSPLDIFNPQIH